MTSFKIARGLTLSNDPFEAAQQVGTALRKAYPEYVCEVCGVSLFNGPVCAGKDNKFEPGTCSVEHAKEAGATVYDQ